MQIRRDQSVSSDLEGEQFMTNGEQTRKKIAKAAAPIFNKRGYEGSSFNDLMEATAGPLVAKTLDGLNLSVQTYGDVGNDEILLIHGFGQSRLSWSKQTSSSLTEQYRVVTFDLRGHGNSDKPNDAAAYASGEQWADDLHAVMETAGLRRPTLVGWSLGGFITGLYLSKYGLERTAGINLVDALTVFSPGSEFFTQTFGELLPRLASPDLPERATATVEFLASCFATKPEAAAFEQMLIVAGMMPLAVTQGLLKVSGATLDEAFAKSGPMLVTYGAKDLLFEPGMSTRMQALNQTAQVSLYQESGARSFLRRTRPLQPRVDRLHQPANEFRVRRSLPQYIVLDPKHVDCNRSRRNFAFSCVATWMT
jgi:pimeloyl-ACP methyl ester carboxylesterase